MISSTPLADLIRKLSTCEQSRDRSELLIVLLCMGFTKDMQLISEPCRKKTGLRVSNKVQHKPACATTEAG